MTKPDILFIAATHGNERIGVDTIALTLQERSDFDWILGNPRAFIQNARFLEADMNRCGLGDLRSSIYEKRRAAEIQSIVRDYTYVIDIHGTYQDTETFLLITNPTKENLRLASFFDINKLIIWPSCTPDMRYPMSEFFPCGIEIEVGSQQDPKNTENLYRSLVDFLKNKVMREQLSETEWIERLSQKRLYEMTGHIIGSETLTAEMIQNGKEITVDNETYIPIFVGTYPYTDVLGYKTVPRTIGQIKESFLK